MQDDFAGVGGELSSMFFVGDAIERCPKGGFDRSDTWALLPDIWCSALDLRWRSSPPVCPPGPGFRLKDRSYSCDDEQHTGHDQHESRVAHRHAEGHQAILLATQLSTSEHQEDKRRHHRQKSSSREHGAALEVRDHHRSGRGDDEPDHAHEESDVHATMLVECPQAVTVRDSARSRNRSLSSTSCRSVRLLRALWRRFC